MSDRYSDRPSASPGTAGIARRLALLAFLLLTGPPAFARVNAATEQDSLYAILKGKDSLLFSIGFNTCDTTQFERLLSESFEFWHDEGGITSSKREFIRGFMVNVCGQDYRARRVLREGSLEVFPLRRNGKLYGAIQTGIHGFYAVWPGEPDKLTSRAKFVHVWTLEAGDWKLARGLSFDHRSDATPPTPDFEDVAAVEGWLKERKIPAMGIGIIRDGRLQSVTVFGELAAGRPASVDAVFNVASLTKMLTTAVTLRLVSAGKWSLDEPLYHYWTDPDVKGDPRARLITTRHILNQKSGFRNWRWEEPSRHLAFNFDPGARYQYSGEGFEYLRHALEAKFHKPLDQLADELVFTPLGMTSTHYTWRGVDTTRLAIPHAADGAPLPVTRNKTPNAADLVTTTIGDYGKFLVSVLDGEGLSDTLREQMVSHATVTKENRYIGLGWFIYDPVGNGEYAISHGGDDPGAHSIVFLLPKSRRGLLIFTNSDNGPQAYADIIRAYLKEQGEAIIDIEMK